MNLERSWPPLRWRTIIFGSCYAAFFIFVMAFYLWPEIAHAKAFRAALIAVTIGIALLLTFRSKPRN